MLLYSFIFSPQIVHRKKEKQTTKNNVKVEKEKEKSPLPSLKKTLMKMKKNERLIEKNLFVSFAHIF